MGALIDAINTNNTLGRQNLSDKGVELPETATTYDIMSAIAEIEGGGTEYTNILPKTTIDLANNGETEGWIMGMATVDDFPELTAGQTYSLTIDDETPIDITLTDMEGVLIAGNTAMVEGGDNGEDYIIMFIAEGNMINFGLRSDVEGTHTIKLDAKASGGTEEIETLIDNSGVLESTEGSVEEKVEQLIDKAEELGFFMLITNANQLFQKAHSFPTKAIVNLPNAINARETFANWITAPIPVVEEITVNAPNITEAYSTFWQSWGVEKIILNLSDKCQKLTMTFTYARDVKEIVLNFPTQNITDYIQTFSLCSALEKIVGVLDFSSTTNVNMMFNGCPNLKDVTFEPNTLSISISLAQSSKLTSKSIQSVIDGLATVTTAQTLTLHADVKARLTQTQLDTISGKNWNLA